MIVSKENKLGFDTVDVLTEEQRNSIEEIITEFARYGDYDWLLANPEVEYLIVFNFRDTEHFRNRLGKSQLIVVSPVPYGSLVRKNQLYFPHTFIVSADVATLEVVARAITSYGTYICVPGGGDEYHRQQLRTGQRFGMKLSNEEIQALTKLTDRWYAEELLNRVVSQHKTIASLRDFTSELLANEGEIAKSLVLKMLTFGKGSRESKNKVLNMLLYILIGLGFGAGLMLLLFLIATGGGV